MKEDNINNIKKTLKVITKDSLPDGYYLKHCIYGFGFSVFFFALIYIEKGFNLSVFRYILAVTILYPYSRFVFNNHKFNIISAKVTELILALMCWAFCLTLAPVGIIISLVNRSKEGKV